MNIGGWICMTVAVSTVSALFFWCCWKMFSGVPEQDGSDSPNENEEFENNNENEEFENNNENEDSEDKELKL